MILPSIVNIVILASNYNPSIVSKEWLYQKGIFTDAITHFVHTPVFSLVESDQFSLTVDEKRMQIAVKKVTEDNLSALTAIAQTFVGSLPETPYRGVGFNYHYDMPREKSNLDSMLSPNHAKFTELFSPTYDIGVSVLFEFEKFIVTLRISPSFGNKHQTRLSFNFHSDASTSDEIKERLSSQMKTLEKAETILRGLSKND